MLAKRNINFNFDFFSRWNQLDLSIVFMSIIGIGLEEIEGQVDEAHSAVSCLLLSVNEYSKVSMFCCKVIK